MKESKLYKEKIVQSVLGSRLEQYGFTYAGYLDRMWTLKRVTENNVDQCVIVYKSAHDDSLRLELCTSVQRGHILINGITDDPKYSEQFISFSDENEFTSILELFGDFIIEYGLKKLNEISVPVLLLEPDEQMHRQLFDNHVELADTFSKKNSVCYSDSVDESLDIIGSIIIEGESERKLDDNSKTVLLEITAFFGAAIINSYGGNWEWQKIYNRCCINYVNGKYQRYDFLKWFVNAWEKAEIDSIKNLYDKLIKQ